MSDETASAFALAHVDSSPMEEVAPGIHRQFLLQAGRVTACIYTFAAGASAGTDLHLGRVETGLVLDGELRDERHTYPAGTFFAAQENSMHHPRSSQGARVLIVEFAVPQ